MKRLQANDTMIQKSREKRPINCIDADRNLDSMTKDVCINQRNHFCQASPSAAILSGDAVLCKLEEILTAGLAAYATIDCSRFHPVDGNKGDKVLHFLDSLEWLQCLSIPENEGNWIISHEQKLAFILNLYHIMYIHMALIYGFPKNYNHWQTFMNLPYYSIGYANTFRVSLADLESSLVHVMRGRNPSSQSTLPSVILVSLHDFRAAMALQMNSNPLHTNIIRVYSSTSAIHQELDQMCTKFLANQCMVVEENGPVILLPKVCEWYENDICLLTSRQNKDISRPLQVLQRLVDFMDPSLHDKVKNLMAGSGNSIRVRYNDFWAHESNSIPALATSSLHLLQSFF